MGSALKLTVGWGKAWGERELTDSRTFSRLWKPCQAAGRVTGSGGRQQIPQAANAAFGMTKCLLSCHSDARAQRARRNLLSARTTAPATITAAARPRSRRTANTA